MNLQADIYLIITGGLEARRACTFFPSNMFWQDETHTGEEEREERILAGNAPTPPSSPPPPPSPSRTISLRIPDFVTLTGAQVERDHLHKPKES